MSLLQVRGLSVAVGRPRRNVVEDVSLDVARGSVLGIVGESGSGKTMTARAVLNLLPTEADIVGGSVLFRDVELVGLRESEMRRFRSRQIGMIPQNAITSLNPLMSVGTQLGAVLSRQGLRGRVARDRGTRLLSEMHIPDPDGILRKYPHQLSGGTAQRVVAAMTLASDPVLLIADEPTSSIDPIVQIQFLNLITELQRARQMAVVVITHDIGVVARICDEVIVMYAGRVMERGSTTTVLEYPAHPYTRALLAALPELNAAETRLTPIPGVPISGGIVGDSCPFAPRCKFAWARCQDQAPALFPLGTGHMSSCWLSENSASVRSEAIEE